MISREPTIERLATAQQLLLTPFGLDESHLSRALAEIKARRGPVIAVAHHELPADLADRTIVVPKSEDELDPILMSIPLQILAYHAAVALERDVDKPRNLAKSVTVE